MECWAAPPEMWSKALAMSFGTALLPVRLGKIQPKARGRDGSAELFEWPDGTTMVLLAFKDKYLSVEVAGEILHGESLLVTAAGRARLFKTVCCVA